jgi:hypothetical protein
MGQIKKSQMGTLPILSLIYEEDFPTTNLTGKINFSGVADSFGFEPF